jgi:hypothetical protein
MARNAEACSAQSDNILAEACKLTLVDKAKGAVRGTLAGL